jgi:DNA-binding CsgD family transcriptional regulator
MRARDVALIRKLCGLGLPPQTLAMSLLPALRQVIPAHSGGVFWVDGDAQMTELYAERLLDPEAMASYYENHHQDAVRGFAVAFRQRANAADPISSHSFTPAEQESAYFRETLRALDAFHVLYAVLHADGRPFGQLSLYRGASHKPFGAPDERALRAVLRYVSTGLFPRSQASARDASTVVEESFGLIGEYGDVLADTPVWRRLVRLAALSQVSPSRARFEHAAIEESLRAIASAALRSVDGTETTRDTAWGRFVVRTFAMTSASARRQIGVLVRREEPMTLSLLRGAGTSPLSTQQREIAILLARGLTNAEIASTLHLSVNTANYHVKQVLARLEVGDRRSVKDCLLQRARGD